MHVGDSGRRPHAESQANDPRPVWESRDCRHKSGVSLVKWLDSQAKAFSGHGEKMAYHSRC